jgi:uncharacterized protein YciI
MQLSRVGHAVDPGLDEGAPLLHVPRTPPADRDGKSEWKPEWKSSGTVTYHGNRIPTCARKCAKEELFVAQQSGIYYITVLERGESWDTRRPMRQQEQWEEHMAFLDALSDDGLILGGGPLGEGEERFLLVIAAENQPMIENRLAEAPWTRLGMWRTSSVERWEVLLGSRL